MADVKITWLGHAAFLLEAEKKLLIDPFISGNPKAPCTPVALDPDIIAVTHGHRDHLGDTIEIGARTGCRIISIHEVANYIKSKGVFAEGMNKGGTMEVEGVALTMTQALHSSSIDASGFSFDGGSPAGFLIGIGGHSFYHAGDTGVFGDMQLIGELYKPEIALLPIGDRFTMGIKEAVKAVELIQPKIVVPMHYNTFDVIKQDPEEFRKAVEAKVDTKVIIMEPGESIKF
ncbi:metal-dependent hydrolase [Methanosarcina sp. 2.H.T.1A.6]|uniref:metal-dependent hydrolase n=1 Tax=unclassified Methanosarcina TaxID=2644672 RepID=UPI000621E80A|nr:MULTISPECIES: metal-dependent hydrolase [unclassified Methanosarcina]KKG15093.1 metal-dependent hydrolase [Methanosarcina sp. 2.H.T.1A.3]KKG20792.1 metal-dependent hydrolase [Methanosarcina sp. 2.H.T.1A.8]KKG22109.1 metal-dependent hydrolase [Methanosarcina sp. 2.H.T.1A.6]KKG24991.1 metal-dependent hydrolase [Methanosarcina sp. 2.H.T.1A.15]